MSSYDYFGTTFEHEMLFAYGLAPRRYRTLREYCAAEGGAFGWRAPRERMRLYRAFIRGRRALGSGLNANAT